MNERSFIDRVRRLGIDFAPHLGSLLVGVLAGAVLFATLSSPESETSSHDSSHSDSGTTAAEQWTCAMHPQIRQSEPGACPICGMDLVEAGSLAEADGHEGRVALSKRAQALARLRTTSVRRRDDASAQVRLLGRIEPNESSLRTITSWTGGRIDRLHVNITGQRVRAGQAIATLYSPEVFAAHQDLLTARRQVERLSSSPPASQRAADAALNAAHANGCVFSGFPMISWFEWRPNRGPPERWRSAHHLREL